MTNSLPMIDVRDISKTFRLHLRGGAELPVLRAASLQVAAGECVTLHGASGSGKSTLLRSLYGTYRPQQGHVRLRHRGEMVDLVTALPRQILDVRRYTLGYVTQFLRVVPRVSTLDIVAEPLMTQGNDEAEARRRAGELLERLGIAGKLWDLPPATFSGGEQQRVNIARVFAAEYPILLLDEPTASLDEANAQTVIELIKDARSRGTAIVAIVHEPVTRAAITTRLVPVAELGEAA